ncbi:PAS domain S-box protein [uncultured Xanthomonas sp.]|uniref:PAS domain S-box protein n=2 Tax=uncultured Xanthomonas sp. TaxID=152831 RepID=UPI0025D39C10|nr:PAS domain S-box protein [uncultured Xanthomonas sp.]
MSRLLFKRSPFYWSLATLLIGAALTTAVALQLQRANARHTQAQLDAKAHVAFDRIEELLSNYDHGLRGMRGMIVTAGDELHRDQVLRYSQSRDLRREFPGARGFGFIRRVAAAEQERFVANERALGSKDFDIRQLAPHSGDRFVIQYIEPVDSNAAALGLDIASESSRRGAAMAAALSGESRLTGPITLVQAGAQHAQSFLLLLPVYRSATTPPTAAQRLRELRGWTYAPLLMPQVMQALDLDPQRIELTLSDENADAGATPFYRNVPQATLAQAPRAELRRDVMGRHWRMDMVASPAFVAASARWSVHAAVLGGALLSVLASALAFALCSNHLRRRQIARDQANLVAVVQSSADGIIGKTLEGVVTSWNRAAEQLFGFSEAEAVGRRLGELIVPPELMHEEESVLRRIGRGEDVPYFETVRRHADGRMIDVLVSVSPIYNAQGRPIGASKTVRDISEQKAVRAQILALNATLESQVAARTAELSRSTAMLEGVLSAASEVAIIATDRDGTITLFNTGAERLLGYRREDVVGTLTPAAFHRAEEVAARGAMLAAELGYPVEGFRVFVEKTERDGADICEWTYVRRDGTTRQVSLVVTAIRTAQGELSGYLGIALDISERQAAERSLARSMALTQAILDTAVNPIMTFDARGKVRSVNRAGERVFGYGAEEIVGEDVSRLMPEAASSLHAAMAADVPPTGTWPERVDSAHELQALRKNGDAFAIEISLGSMWMDGEYLVVGVIADITERNRQRQALTRAHDQLAMAADAAELGIWTWTPGDDALECNERMYDLYEWPAALRERGLRYSDWRVKVHPDDIAISEASLQAAMERGTVYDPVFRVQCSDGGLRHIQAGAHTERDAQGRVTRVIGINRDISAQLQAEQDLRQAKARADEASQAKSSFLANMSHEIRTPMNAVLGMLQLLQRTALDARQDDYVGKAQKAGKSLLSLLNDILDYSKIEAGKLQLDLHPFRIEELLRDLAVVLAGNHQRPEVEIVYQLDRGIPDRVIGDALRLQQVLINLAGNALKFTEHGHVRLRVELLQRQAQAVTLRMIVEDTGIGISAEQQQRIFHSFTQAEASISRRFGGSGLGLVISRRLIGMMGGELQVHSVLGEGSRFWFDLPLMLDANGETAAGFGCARPRHVLVVDDSALVREVLTDALGACGWQVEGVASGEDAVARAIAAEREGARFDAVLMDWRLPGIDGVTAAAQLRAMCAAPPLVLMLTAYQSELLGQTQRHVSPPFADHLVKPVTPCQVIEALERAWSGGARIAAPVPVSQRVARLPGLRVLVVEDNALNRQVAEELLCAEGAQVALAEDGLSGVQCVRDSGQVFDVVVMDMQMPRVDGLEATRRIRADARFARLPILAMTANAAQDDVDACLAAGMDAHIGKPIDLEQMVEALLRLSGRTAAPASVAPQPAPPEPAAPAALDAILARFGNNSGLFVRMLDAFAEEHRTLLQRVEAALRQGDAGATADAAHALKGSAATLGAANLAQAAAVLEQNARGGRLPDVAATLAALRAAATQDLEALRTAAAPLRAPAPPAGMDAMAEDALLPWLRALEPLLRQSDLAALTLLEQAPPAIAGAQAGDALRLREQVQTLRFDDALVTLNNLLETAFR